MPLTFGDMHPAAMPAAGPVDTADMLFAMDEIEALRPVANSSLQAMVFSVGEKHLLRGEQNIEKQMTWMRWQIDNLEGDGRRLQADNSSLQADKTGLEAENRRLETENRSLQAQVRRFNDAWRQIAHVSRSALKQPVPAP